MWIIKKNMLCDLLQTSSYQHSNRNKTHKNETFNQVFFRFLQETKGATRRASWESPRQVALGHECLRLLWRHPSGQRNFLLLIICEVDIWCSTTIYDDIRRYMTIYDDEWWMMNDEWWIMNYELWMMNDEWWMMDDDDDDDADDDI